MIHIFHRRKISLFFFFFDLFRLTHTRTRTHMDTQMESSTLEPFPLYVAVSDQSNVCENTQDGCCCEGVRPPLRHLSTQSDVSSWTTEDLDDLDAFFEDIRHTDDEEEHDMDDDVYRLGAVPVAWLVMY